MAQISKLVISNPSPPHELTQFSLPRNKTALFRTTSSKPVALVVADGLLARQRTFFDYGCGRGVDIRYVRRKKIKADGWDPYYRPNVEPVAADLVNLGYVLNVIEDQAERAETLQRAYRLARQLLLVAVRVEQSLDEDLTYADGVITRRGTFQKLFTQGEFRAYLEQILDCRPHLVAPGIAYVFKDEKLEAEYLATRAFTRRLEYRAELIEQFRKDRAAQRYVTLTNRLGRVPFAEEFPQYHKLLEAYGSPQRLTRLTLRQVDQQAFLGSQAQRREDILTYLAMIRLQGLRPPRFQSLPSSVQGDIKAIWRTYTKAQAEGDHFLFSLGRPDVVQEAAKTSPVGKLLPEHLYVHRSAEDELPALLRIILFAAGQIIGDVPYDLAKIALDGRAVSFLHYTDFDHDPHPALLHSVRVYLPKATYNFREYRSSPNPPILHRKETFVAPSYPHYEKFRRLTEQEEAEGLLSSPAIGFRSHWQALLEAQNLRMDDHSLQPVL